MMWLAVALAGCTNTAAPSDGGTDASLREAARGKRYCEVLLVTLTGANVHIEVHNTYGLNDCPADAWTQLDTAQLQAQYAVTMVVLNGPRYWLLDAFDQGAPLDPTPRMFGTLAMYHVGNLDLPLAQAHMDPYAPRTVQRVTMFRFEAGKAVYELVDPTGRVFDMQSYSVQTTAQTEADLPSLGSRLTLPMGWSYRSRVLAADLVVTAVNGMATVVQDEVANTYQLSQQ